MKPTKNQFFERQITLSEIGEEGQLKLQKASVLVVGCGGLGSPIAVHLAASGIGKIHLVDFDTIDVSNLHRQVYYELADVGKSKSETLANFIKKRAPFTEVTFSTKPVAKSTVFKLISEVDIVIDGTDSLPTKYLLNDACVLQNKPLIYGSLYKFDGYVASFNVRQKDDNFSANLRDAFPEMATDVPNCEEAGTLNAVVGIIALQQVNEVLKLVARIGKPLINQLLVYNSLESSQLKMKLKPVDSCHSERQRRISAIFKNETYFDENCEIQNPDWLISADELKNQLFAKTALKPFIISVVERKVNYPFKIDKTISLGDIKNENFMPKSNRNYIFICEQGMKSYAAVSFLKAFYPKVEMLSLIGGISKY